MTGPSLPDTALSLSARSAEGADTPWLRWLVLVTAGVVILRYVVLIFTPLDLFYDEAQYWFWAQDPALGYFSKPPLLAWIIAGTTALCGDTEPCVRAAAPLFHGLTTLAMFALGRTLYDERTGFFAALAYLLAIAVSASSLLISTDVPLLLCWVVGLWAFARFTEAPSFRLALIVGAAIALGINAKYAMVYFILCAGMYLAFTPDKRPLLRLPSLWVGLMVGLSGFVPNLVWNAQHDFITFAHTGENITGGDGLGLNPFGLLEFVGSQFGVAGPILFAAAGIALLKRWRSGRPKADRLLWFFALPILAVLTFQALQSQANYNWAATAYPALILVTTGILVSRRAMRWVRWNLITCAAAGALLGFGALAILLLRPDDPIISRTNLEDMYGWQEHAAEIAEELDRFDVDTIVTVGRRYAAGFAYYLRERPEAMRTWHPEGAPPRNHFEFVQPWHGPKPGERAMILSPGNVRPLSNAQLVAVVEADEGTRLFRSNSYLFLAVGPQQE